MVAVAAITLGIAGATLMPSTLSLIRGMFPDPTQRTVAIGAWVTSLSVGSAIGPLVGGALLELFWWRVVFLMAVPVVVLSNDPESFEDAIDRGATECIANWRTTPRDLATKVGDLLGQSDAS